MTEPHHQKTQDYTLANSVGRGSVLIRGLVTQQLTNGTALTLPRSPQAYPYVLRTRTTDSTGRKWKRRRRGSSTAFLGAAQCFVDDKIP